MAQQSTPKAEESKRLSETYVTSMRNSAEHFAKAAEQLADKGRLRDESHYAKGKAEGKVDGRVAGRDTLKAEAGELRKEAASVRDAAGAKKLGDRIARLDVAMQVSTAQAARDNPGHRLFRPAEASTFSSMFSFSNKDMLKPGDKQTAPGANLEDAKASLRKIAPAIDQGRAAFHEGNKVRDQLRAQEGPHSSKGPFKAEHRAVEGAERAARALSTSEKLDKASRDKYAALADKLHNSNAKIHDKASASAAYKEAQAAAKAMKADAPKATDKAREVRSGLQQAKGPSHHKSDHSVKVAKATTALAKADRAVATTQKELKAATEKVAEAGKPLAAAKAEAEAATKAVQPLEKKLSDEMTKLTSAEKANEKAQADLAAAQKKLETIQAENKASLFGGLFGGAKKEEEAAKAVAKAQEAVKATDGKLQGAKADVATALTAVDKAKETQTLTTEKLAGLEKAHAAAQAEVTRLNASAEAAAKAREASAAQLTKLDGKPHKEPLPNAEKLAAQAEAKEAGRHKGDKPKADPDKSAPAKDGAPKDGPAKNVEKDAQGKATPTKDGAAPKEPAKDAAAKDAPATKTGPEAASKEAAAKEVRAAATAAGYASSVSAADKTAERGSNPENKQANTTHGRNESSTTAVERVRSTLTSVEPNARLNAEGVTPLMVAARMGDVPMVKELVAKGADLTLKNNEGKTAMDIAAGNKEVSRVLEGAMLAKDAGVPYRDTTTATSRTPNVLSQEHAPSGPESMFSGGADRKAPAAAAPAAPDMATPKSESAPPLVLRQPAEQESRQADRQAPEREMSR